MIGSDYPVIESGDFGCHECAGIASSLCFKSKSDPKTFVFVLWIAGCCWSKDQSDDDVAQSIVDDDDDVADQTIRV